MSITTERSRYIREKTAELRNLLSPKEHPYLSSDPSILQNLGEEVSHVLITDLESADSTLGFDMYVQINSHQMDTIPMRRIILDEQGKPITL